MKPTLLDKVVAYVSPEAGVARLKARTQMAIAGAWAGGSLTRLQTANWVPFGGSPETDSMIDRRWLRNRSRDLQRNNPLARGAINTVVTSAVGTGLVLRSRIDAEALGLSPEAAQKWQRHTEREFSLWADNPRACDAEATLDWFGLQSLAFRSALESGDTFAALPMVPRVGCPYDTKVQLIEADRLVNNKLIADTIDLFGGIKRGKFGEPIEYHILRQHPGGMLSPGSFTWDIVPAFGRRTGRRNIIHLYDKLRPGQPRGLPYLSPVIETLKQLGDYTDGELRAALVSSMFTVFVKSESGFGLGVGSDGNQATSPAQTGDNLRLGSGAIVDLNPGDDVSFANPGRPNTAFDPFVQALLRQIGSALELPFEILIKHFSSSYSASRAALLDAWRFYKGRRAWLAAMFCSPVYEAWLDEAVASGRIDAEGYFDDPERRAAYLRAEWIGDTQGQIDPLKEAMAAEKRLALVLTSYADETTQLTGQDWRDVVAARAAEEKELTDAKLRPLLPDAKGVPVDPNGEPPQGVPGAPGQPTQGPAKPAQGPTKPAAPTAPNK